MKKKVVFAAILLILVVSIFAAQDSLDTEKDDDKEKISKNKIINPLGSLNAVKEWVILENTEAGYSVSIDDPRKHKAEICFIYDAAKSLNEISDQRNIYDDKMQVIESLAKKEKVIKDKDGQDKQQFGYCYTIKDEKYVKFGEHSIVLVYQDTNTLRYDYDFGHTNLTLERHNGSVDNVFVYFNESSWKFGANISDMPDEEVFYSNITDNWTNKTIYSQNTTAPYHERFTYRINSSVSLAYVIGGYNITYPIFYSYDTQDDWQEARQHYDFQDICENDFADCIWGQDSATSGWVEFTSGNVVDPTIVNISGCQTLSTGGYYELNTSLVGTNCIAITGDNIHLNLKGYNIQGTGGSSNAAIDISETASNITVINGTLNTTAGRVINDYGNGHYFADLEMTSYVYNDIGFLGRAYDTIVDNIIYNNARFAIDDHDINFTNSLINKSQWGIDFDGQNNILIENVTILDSGNDVIDLNSGCILGDYGSNVTIRNVNCSESNAGFMNLQSLNTPTDGLSLLVENMTVNGRKVFFNKSLSNYEFTKNDTVDSYWCINCSNVTYRGVFNNETPVGTIVSVIDSTDVTIINASTIDGSGRIAEVYLSDNVTVANCSLHNSRINGVRFGDNNNSKIQNFVGQNITFRCVILRDSSHNQVINVTCNDTGGLLIDQNAQYNNLTDIRLIDSVADIKDTSDNNRFINFNSTGATSNPIDLESDNNYFENVFIDDYIGASIYLYSASNNYFKKVLVTNADTNGIIIGDGGCGGNSRDNLFEDLNQSTALIYDIVITSAICGGQDLTNNTFLNSTYSTESITNAFGIDYLELIRDWKYNVTLKNQTGDLIDGEIKVYEEGDFVESINTSSGSVIIGLAEYTNEGAGGAGKVYKESYDLTSARNNQIGRSFYINSTTNGNREVVIDSSTPNITATINSTILAVDAVDSFGNVSIILNQNDSLKLWLRADEYSVTQSYQTLVGSGTIFSAIYNPYIDFDDDLLPLLVPDNSNGVYKVTFTSGSDSGNSYTIIGGTNLGSWNGKDYFYLGDSFNIVNVGAGDTFNVEYIVPQLMQSFTVTDYFGNQNTILDGAVIADDGYYGRAFYFGNGDYANVSNVNQWYGNYTVSLWVRTKDPSLVEYTGIFSSATPGSVPDSFQIDIGGSGLGCEGQYGFLPANATGDNPTRYCMGTISDKWVMLTVSQNGTHVMLYRDDSLYNTTGLAGYGNFSEYKLGLNRGNTNYFNGMVDDVLIWNRSLDAREVSLLYASSTTKSNESLPSYTDGKIYVQDTGSNERSTVNFTADFQVNTTNGSIYQDLSSLVGHALENVTLNVSSINNDVGSVTFKVYNSTESITSESKVRSESLLFTTNLPNLNSFTYELNLTDNASTIIYTGEIRATNIKPQIDQVQSRAKGRFGDCQRDADCRLYITVEEDACTLLPQNQSVVISESGTVMHNLTLLSLASESNNTCVFLTETFEPTAIGTYFAVINITDSSNESDVYTYGFESVIDLDYDDTGSGAGTTIIQLSDLVVSPEKLWVYGKLEEIVNTSVAISNNGTKIERLNLTLQEGYFADNKTSIAFTLYPDERETVEMFFMAKEKEQKINLTIKTSTETFEYEIKVFEEAKGTFRNILDVFLSPLFEVEYQVPSTFSVISDTTKVRHFSFTVAHMIGALTVLMILVFIIFSSLSPERKTKTKESIVTVNNS